MLILGNFTIQVEQANNNYIMIQNIVKHIHG